MEMLSIYGITTRAGQGTSNRITIGFEGLALRGVSFVANATSLTPLRQAPEPECYDPR
jgi:hypothetical protein